MTIKMSDLHINEPCHADWSAMTGDDKKKFCSLCTKHVHDLSQMTEAEATELVDDARAKAADDDCDDDGLCVRYGVDADGNLVFAEPEPTSRRHFLKASLMAASVAIATPALASSVVAEVDGCKKPSRIERIVAWAQSWFEEEPAVPLMGEIEPVIPEVVTPKPPPEMKMIKGGIRPTPRPPVQKPVRPKMGKMAPPPKGPKPKLERVIMGDVIE